MQACKKLKAQNAELLRVAEEAPVAAKGQEREARELVAQAQRDVERSRAHASKAEAEKRSMLDQVWQQCEARAGGRFRACCAAFARGRACATAQPRLLSVAEQEHRDIGLAVLCLAGQAQARGPKSVCVPMRPPHTREPGAGHAGAGAAGRAACGAGGAGGCGQARGGGVGAGACPRQ